MAAEILHGYFAASQLELSTQGDTIFSPIGCSSLGFPQSKAACRECEAWEVRHQVAW